MYFLHLCLFFKQGLWDFKPFLWPFAIGTILAYIISMMRLLLKFIFGLGCWLCLQGLVWAGPCEEVAFSKPEDFVGAMTEGLSLRGRKKSLFEFYKYYSYPYPHKSEGYSLKDVFRILDRYPELSKPRLREQILTFLLKERDNPQSLKSFVRSLTHSAGQIRSNLFQIESNLGYWIKMLNFSSTDISRTDISSLKKGEVEQPSHKKGTENNTTVLNKEGIGPHASSLSKQEKKALKQKQNQKQKEDFIAYLNTTALNKETRDFIKDTSQPYRERAIVLYKALEKILGAGSARNSLSLAQNHNQQNKAPPFVPADTATLFPPDKGGTRLDGGQGGSFVPHASRIEQAMVELVHTVGFGNTAWVASLKSKDPAQSYESLRKILNERDILAFDLGFEGHFAEMTKKFNAKIEDTDPQLKQIEKDIQNQPWTIKGKEVLRLRVLSLQESPFRSCMGGDCATRDYFEKALDPNFVYFTLTDKNHRSSGTVTVVLGTAINTEGQTVKIAFVDKIQNVPTDRITAMLEGIRLSLKKQGYILGLPKEVGRFSGLSTERLIRDYVAEDIAPKLKNSLVDFRPHKHKYSFESRHSRADEKLGLWEFEGINSKDVQIKAGEIHLPKIASPSLTGRSLYKPILSLRDSRKEEDQIKFLDNLATMSQMKELGLSQWYVRSHLDFVLKDKDFSFKVRKKAFYTLIEFALLEGTISIWSILAQSTDSFSSTEITGLIGEMSNWKNTSGYRKTFIKKLNTYEGVLNTSYLRGWGFLFSPFRTTVIGRKITDLKNRGTLWAKPVPYFESVLESKWEVLLDKNALLMDIIHWTGTIGTSGKILYMLRILLEKGANVNVRIGYFDTALMFASYDGLIEIAQLLLEKGANPNVQDNKGQTALMWASRRGHKEIARLLLEKGANPHIQDNKGYTALMWASQKGYKEIVQMLLEKGANVNAKNDRGETALMWASRRGHKEIAQLLLEKGANVNVKNNQGETALMFAKMFAKQKNKWTEIVDLIQQFKQNPIKKAS